MPEFTRPSSRRRAVITGIGPITCIGIGKENFWRGILAERHLTHHRLRHEPVPRALRRGNPGLGCDGYICPETQSSSLNINL